MELWKGMNLYEKLANDGKRFSEYDCAKLMQKILLALHHWHTSGITHRDIKLENIMITKDNQVRLIDFGLSKNASIEEMMKSMSGTPYYMAPEIFTDKKYDSSVDIWSLGVVLYTLLCGYRPFWGENLKALSINIIHANYKFPSKDWGSISNDAKDLISRMLKPKPKERLTAARALRQPWFGLITDIKLEKTVKLENTLMESTLTKLKEYIHDDTAISNKITF